MKYGRSIFAFLFLTTALGFLVWVLEVSGARVLILQHRAESFVAVEGRVLFAEITVTYGSKRGNYYHPAFWYEYQVEGQTYTGRRYRYDSHPSFSSRLSAEEIVNAHRIGSAIEVYYDPADPREAVLSRPVRGYDIGPLLMGLPMCLFVLFGMIKIGRETILPGRAMPVAGGVKIISERMIIRVRLPQYDPLARSLMTSGVLSFILGLVMASITNNIFEVAEMMVLSVVLAGVGVYFWMRQKISSGSQDLVIDEAARTVQLPLTYKRRELIQCAFSDVTGVRLEKVAHRQKRGVTYTYAPTLLIAGKQSQRLTDLSKRRAESLAAWLREKLGLVAAKGETTRIEK